ncbi:uncharacterized protein LOC141908535 [Tubulanus polymorphus]|uniref:uncharacterized protein LOC141908535 n=1 Tax=Tubulanus polymorphus TaxID=672921 RepID=UPI003DA41EAF
MDSMAKTEISHDSSFYRSEQLDNGDLSSIVEYPRLSSPFFAEIRRRFPHVFKQVSDTASSSVNEVSSDTFTNFFERAKSSDTTASSSLRRYRSLENFSASDLFDNAETMGYKKTVKPSRESQRQPSTLLKMDSALSLKERLRHNQELMKKLLEEESPFRNRGNGKTISGPLQVPDSPERDDEVKYGTLDKIVGLKYMTRNRSDGFFAYNETKDCAMIMPPSGTRVETPEISEHCETAVEDTPKTAPPIDWYKRPSSTQRPRMGLAITPRSMHRGRRDKRPASLPGGILKSQNEFCDSDSNKENDIPFGDVKMALNYEKESDSSTSSAKSLSNVQCSRRRRSLCTPREYSAHDSDFQNFDSIEIEMLDLSSLESERRDKLSRDQVVPDLGSTDERSLLFALGQDLLASSDSDETASSDGSYDNNEQSVKANDSTLKNSSILKDSDVDSGIAQTPQESSSSNEGAESRSLTRYLQSSKRAPTPNTLEYLRGAQMKRRQPVDCSGKKGPLKADHSLKPLSGPNSQRPVSVDAEVAKWNSRGARPKFYPSLDKENQPQLRSKRRDSPSSQRVRFQDDNSDSSCSQRSTPVSSDSESSRKCKTPRCLDGGDSRDSKRCKIDDIPTQAEFENGIVKHRATPVLALPTPDVEKNQYAEQLRRQWTKFERQQSVQSRRGSDCGANFEKRLTAADRSTSVPSALDRRISSCGYVNPVTDKLLKTKLKRAPMPPRGPIVADHSVAVKTSSESENYSTDEQNNERSNVDDENADQNVSELISDFSEKSHTYLPTGAIDTYALTMPSNTAEAPASGKQTEEENTTPVVSSISREKSASEENISNKTICSPPRVRASSVSEVSTPQQCIINRDISVTELPFDSPDRRTSGCFSNLQSTKGLSSSRTSIGEAMDNIKSSVKKKFTSLRRAMSVDSIDRKSKQSIKFEADGSVKVKKAPSVTSLFKKKHKRAGSVDPKRLEAMTQAVSQQGAIQHAGSYTSLSDTLSYTPDAKTTSTTSVDNPRHFRPIGTLKGLNSDGTQIVQLQKPPHGPFGFYVSRGNGKLKTHVFISRMSDGYPEKFFAGLLSIGDEILEINGKPAKKMSVDEIYDVMATNDTVMLKTLPLMSRDLYTKK